MPFIRDGSVVQQRSFLEELLDLPYQMYALICYFFATLFNVRPLPPAAAARSRCYMRCVLTCSALPESQPDAVKQKRAPRRDPRKGGGFGGGGGGEGGGGGRRTMGRVQGAPAAAGTAPLLHRLPAVRAPWWGALRALQVQARSLVAAEPGKARCDFRIVPGCSSNVVSGCSYMMRTWPAEHPPTCAEMKQQVPRIRCYPVRTPASTRCSACPTVLVAGRL